jgi:hypothetical protein
MAASSNTTTSKGKVVKYVGTADERVINAADWKKVGSTDQKQVKWDASNKFTVPAADLDEAALKYVDEVDSGFVVADAE